MAHHTIKFEGLYELQKKLKENVTMDDVKRVVRHHGSKLQQKAQDNADFRGHYRGNKFIPPTGKLKGSIMLDTTKNNGLTAEVEPTAEYAPYPEFGTRFMDAQPYLKPAWEEQKEAFKRDMDKLVR